MSDPKDWNKLTLGQLREELESRGMDTQGKKAELVTRLENLSMTGSTETSTEQSNDEVTDAEVEPSQNVEFTEVAQMIPDIQLKKEPEEEECDTTVETMNTITMTFGMKKDDEESEMEETGDAAGDVAGDAAEEAGEDEVDEAPADDADNEKESPFAAAVAKYANSKYYQPFVQYFPDKGDKNHCTVHPPTNLRLMQELKSLHKSKIVNIYPVEMQDMSKPEILCELEKCDHFSMNYYRNTEREWAGCLKLLYRQQSDAEDAKQNLHFDEKYVKGDFSQADRAEMEVAINKPSITNPAESIKPERLLYVAPLKPEITVQDLRGHFPDPEDILIFDDEPKPLKSGAQNIPDVDFKPLRHAYLVYSDKETARKAALSYCDPEDNFCFLGKVASVVPAQETEGDPIFNVLHKGRRKHLVRGIALSQCWLDENKNAPAKEKRSRYKHSRYHYNCLKRDEDARKELGLQLLEPRLDVLVPDIKLLWTERAPGETTIKTKGGNRGRGSSFSGFNAQPGRGKGFSRGAGAQGKGGPRPQPRGRSGYPVGGYKDMHNQHRGKGGRGGARVGRGKSAFTEEETWDGWDSWDAGWGGDSWGQSQASFAAAGYPGTSAGYRSNFTGFSGMSADNSMMAQQMKVKKKATLLQRLSNLLDLDDDEESVQRYGGYGQGGFGGPGYPGGGFGSSFQQGFKRPGNQDMSGSSFKRHRGGMNRGGW